MVRRTWRIGPKAAGPPIGSLGFGQKRPVSNPS